MLKKITQCRVCGNPNLRTCIDIGDQYLSSIFPENLNYHNDLKKLPLEIAQCMKTEEGHCGSLQLTHEIDITDMYQHYPYTSSSNTAMQKILEDVATSGIHLGHLRDQDVILDIGCNDGTLLRNFESKNYQLVGIDPAQNVETKVNAKSFTRVKDFFTAKNYEKVTPKKAKLVFSVAMFYHLGDPVSFVKDIADILDDEGVAIVQMAYLPAMIKTNMYDNIVHEHVGYYGTQHMKWIFEQAGLELFDVLLNDVYGGSFRIFAKKKGQKYLPATDRLKQNLQEELEWGIFSAKTYDDFMTRIKKTKIDLLDLCKKIQQEGKNIWVYGASTKGNTILQFCGLGSKEITAAADSNPFKFNKYLIGSDIPIKNEDEMRKASPDYLLSLPYSFTSNFLKREEPLIQKGTKFIVPLPEVKVLP